MLHDAISAPDLRWTTAPIRPANRLRPLPVYGIRRDRRPTTSINIRVESSRLELRSDDRRRAIMKKATSVLGRSEPMASCPVRHLRRVFYFFLDNNNRNVLRQRGMCDDVLVVVYRRVSLYVASRRVDIAPRVASRVASHRAAARLVASCW